MTNSIGTYKYASNEIKGYSSSTLAKGEKDDCFVRAVASATDVSYEVAHAYVKDFFGRQDKKGTNFVSTTMMKLEDNGMQIGNKEFDVRVLSRNEITNKYKLHGDIVRRKKTVKSFIKDYPKGTYIVGVSKHAFTVIDGILIDNAGEEFRPTRKVDSVFHVENLRKENVQLSLF